MGPYDISNNERHVHTIDGHTKCLYAAKFALEWKISDTEKVPSITWSNLPKLLTYRQGRYERTVQNSR